jgi:hypothetical protein
MSFLGVDKMIQYLYDQHRLAVRLHIVHIIDVLFGGWIRLGFFVIMLAIVIHKDGRCLSSRRNNHK